VHRKELAIYERLYEREPARGSRNVALLRKKVGALLEKLGDLWSAQESYRRAILLDRERSQANPLDSNARLDLSFSYGSLAGCLRVSGDLAAARENFLQALAIRQELAAADPKNQRFRLAVASALTRVGLVELKAGDPAAARDHSRQALSVYEAISRGDPANGEAREDVAAGLGADAGARAGLPSA